MAVFIARMRRRRLVVRYEDRLLIGFLLGVICGTAAANLMYQQIQDQAGYFAELMDLNLNLTVGEQKELFLYVCRQRVIQTLFAWLVGLTVFSVPCFCVLAAGCGMSVGVVLAITTCQRGLAGLLWYLMTLFPHYLIYVPVWCVLASWAGNKTGKIRLLPLCALLLLVLIGAGMEAFLNPYALKLLYKN